MENIHCYGMIIGGMIQDCDIIPKFVRNAARLNDNLSMAEMIDNGTWQWPNGWIQAFPALASVTTPSLNDDTNDNVLWTRNNGDLAEFSVKIAWDDMRRQG